MDTQVWAATLALHFPSTSQTSPLRAIVRARDEAAAAAHFDFAGLQVTEPITATQDPVEVRVACTEGKVWGAAPGCMDFARIRT